MSRIYGMGVLKSMAIAFKNFMRPPITLQYPRDKWQLPERARWAVAPLYDEAGAPKCRACMICVNTCPDYILALEFTTDPDTKAKHIVEFTYQVGACMMCGLCVEACPYDAIEMSHEYELAQISPDKLEYDLLRDIPAASAPKRTEAAPKPVAASGAAPEGDAPATAKEDSDA